MTLVIDEQFTAKNWTAAANVAATWGIGPRTITSITIHWWGDPVGQTYAGIIDWFCNPKSAVTTSAHYVASAAQAACIVSPWDAAWHAGSAYGNVHSIGIECNPRCSDADYAAIADVVAQLRKMYGNLPLFPHNHWTSTTCPGDYRLDRIDTLATAILNGDTMTQADIDQIVSKVNAYTAALLVGQWTDGKATTHPGIGLVVEQNQRDIRSNGTGIAANGTALAALVARPATVAATVDVVALAAQLKDALAPSIVAALAAQLAK